MRILLLVALAFAIVMAEPEADANADPYYGYYYNGYGLGYPYRYRVGYYGYPYRYLGKREAEAYQDPIVKSKTTVLGNLGTIGYYGGPLVELTSELLARTQPPSIPTRSTVITAEAKPVAVTSTLGQVNYDPAFIHPNGALPILAKPIIGAKGDALTTRLLDAPYGIPYRYGPTVPGEGPKEDAFGRRYWW